LQNGDGLRVALDFRSGLLSGGLRKERKECSQGDKKSHDDIYLQSAKRLYTQIPAADLEAGIDSQLSTG